MKEEEYFEAGLLVPGAMECMRNAHLRIQQLDQPDAAALPSLALEGACSDMSQSIQAMCDAMALRSRELSPEVLSNFAYAMTAWADEAMILRFSERLPRPLVVSVERRLFGTMDAGDEVFLRIERAIERRSSSDVLMYPVYLLLLSMGFRGRFAESMDTETLTRLHGELADLAIARRRDIALEEVRVSSELRRQWFSLVDTRRSAHWLLGATLILGLLAMQLIWFVLARTSFAELLQK